MPAIALRDLDAPDLVPYRNLKHHIQSGAEDFVVESSLVIERLLDSAYRVHSLLLTPQRYESLAAQSTEHVPVYVAPKDLISKIAGFEVHRGCLARAGMPEERSDLREFLDRENPQSVLVLEGLADPTNVGAIVRNAAAFGVDMIITDPRGASPFSRRAARTSAGHIFRVPVFEKDPLEAIALLRQHDSSFEVVAATPSSEALLLRDYRPPGPLVLMVGNEGIGLTPGALKASDRHVRIPMASGVDSLNVAASVAVLLYALIPCVTR